MRVDRIMNVAHTAAAGAGKSIDHASTALTTPALMSKGDFQALRSGDVATGWNMRPTSIEAAREAQQRGAVLFNDVDSVLASHRKVDLAKVLDRAGVPHAADGIPVRTRAEFDAALAEQGGAVRLTGGFSQSRVAAYGADVPLSRTGAPEVVTSASPPALDRFAETNLDRTRTYLMQKMPAAGEQHVVTAGGRVLDDVGVGSTLSQSEREMVVRATDAFGLRAGGVDITRGADGSLRVLDVHATPRVTTSELERIAGDSATRDRILAHAPSSVAGEVDAAKTSVGVLNMGNRPGKNISRVLAEIERQGGRPVFLPSAATAVQDGKVLVHGVEQPIDSVITRTGSIISDDALETLGKLDDAGIPILNRAGAMSLVRDKNTQARVLVDSGTAHPVTTTVQSVEDADKAVKLIGSSMVLKNPASSEGRGVMFLEGEDTVRGVTNLFAKRGEESRLVATSPTTGRSIDITSRDDAERAIRELGEATLERNAASGVDELRMQQPIRLADPTTGAGVDVKLPVSVLSIGDAFRDAKPGAVLKAEQWFREAAGVDTRVHVARGADGQHRVIAAMERRAHPNEFGEARSNLSLGGGATAITPNAEQIETAIRGAKAFDLDIAGVDLIASKQGPVVLEVNASPGLDIEQATGPVADRWVSEALRIGAPHRAAR